MNFKKPIFSIIYFVAFGSFSQATFPELQQEYEQYLSADMDLAKTTLDKMGTVFSNESEKLTFYQSKAQYFIYTTQYDSADLYMTLAGECINNDRYEALVSQEILRANLHYRKRELNEGLHLLKALKPKLEPDDYIGKSRLFALTGSIYFKKGKMDSATFFLDHALTAVSSHSGDEVLGAEARVLSIKGQIFLYQGQYDSSATYQFGALERYQEIGNYRGMAFCYAEIAGIKMYSNQLDEAIAYYYKAIDYFKRVKKPNYVIYNNIGSIYVQQRKLDSAKICFQTAFKGAETMRQIDLKANAAGGLGNVYSLTEELDSSIYYYQIAQSIFKQLGYTQGVALTEMTLANVTAKKGQNQQAQAYLDSAEIHVRHPTNQVLLPVFYEAQYEVRYTQGHYREALEAFQQLTAYNDSIQSANSEERISQLEANYNLKIVNQENALLKADKKASEVERKRRQLMYGVGIGLLLVVLIFLFLINLSRKRKLKLREAEVKRKSLEQEILQGKLNEARRVILAKTEMLAKMSEQQASDIDYTEMSGKILEKITLTQEWAEFTIEFNALYGDFYESLKTICEADLTKNELRLCALIKLNLSNKEIAELLYVTVDAVKKAKNRLSKKIRLGEKDQLTTRITAL